jgi:hypothetical protein
MEKKDLKLELALSIKEQLKEAGFSSFLGGSYRFGYQNRSSDIDLFANSNGLNGEEILDKLQEICMGVWGFTGNNSYKKGFTLQVKGFGFVHLTFYNDNDYFNLAMEHNIVEEFLNKNPLLKETRSFCGSGVEFYQKMKGLINK